MTATTTIAATAMASPRPTVCSTAWYDRPATWPRTTKSVPQMMPPVAL
jgi:hypothetical protein